MGLSLSHFRRGLILGRRRFLAVLGPILSREFLLSARIAEEALGLGPVVLLTPVALLLELGGDSRIALAAHFFRHAVLRTPPATVVMGAGRFGAVVMASMSIARLGGARCAAVAASGGKGADRQQGNGNGGKVK